MGTVGIVVLASIFFRIRTMMRGMTRSALAFVVLEIRELERLFFGKLLMCCLQTRARMLTSCSSVVINKLQKSGTVLYIYGHYEQTESQTPEHLLGSLIKQMVSGKSSGIPKEVEELFKRIGEDDCPLLDDLESTLLKICGRQKDLFIVVDAVDELSNKSRNALLRVFRRLQDVRYLFTCRPHLDLGHLADNAPHRETILRVKAQKKDLQSYLKTQIKADQELQEIIAKDTTYEGRICAKIAETSDGQ